MHTMHALLAPCACEANVILVSSLNLGLLVGVFETQLVVFTDCVKHLKLVTELLQVGLQHWTKIAQKN